MSGICNGDLIKEIAANKASKVVLDAIKQMMEHMQMNI